MQRLYTEGGCVANIYGFHVNWVLDYCQILAMPVSSLAKIHSLTAEHSHNIKTKVND
jgi:hypothetical protein